ncbi:MAG: DUF547 domain-containing protein [Acidobacteria bacterium]|nr:DUF547 domain-containing protein [Acidobacteriota bacterium]
MKPIRMVTLWMMSLPLLAQPGGPEAALWDSLAKRYVNEEARVDYGLWKREGLSELDGFLAQVAAPWPAGMDTGARKAALINTYNALTVRWVLTHYPVQSIMKTPNPFRAARHTVDGRKLSLDEVETQLRKMGDPRVHSVLVCAARSCPPLRREAYTAVRLEEQLEDNTRVWLANEKLNEFAPERNAASVSSIFKWYKGDFGNEQQLRAFLARYSPEGRGAFLLQPKAKLTFKDYDWGLNDASSVGKGYSQWRLYWDVATHYPPVSVGALALLAGLLGGVWWVWAVRRTRAA